MLYNLVQFMCAMVACTKNDTEPSSIKRDSINFNSKIIFICNNSK